jgi:hypothetical protein
MSEYTYLVLKNQKKKLSLEKDEIERKFALVKAENIDEATKKSGGQVFLLVSGD